MRYVSPQTIQSGLISYIAEDMLPKVDGWQKIAFGAALSLGREQDVVSQIMSHPSISMLGIVSQDGLVDIERLKNAIGEQMGNQRIDINIPIVGTFKVGQSDLERLYQTILRADGGER